jgi:prepilin-type N-terminal cleavage/methylation domain-containing protein
MFQRKRRAFTLIELMLVIAIMAVFSAMAMPRYGRSLARYRADVTARRIAADMALVQTRARAMGATRSMTFSLVEGRYQLTGEVDPTTSTSVYTVDLSQNPNRASNLTASFNGKPKQ